MSRATLTTVSPKFQVCVPKPVRDAVGLKAGDLLEAGVERGVIVLRPKTLVDRPIREAVPSAREIRALNRAIAADERGETMPYEQYRAERTARVGRRSRRARTKAAR
ncbi:MAG: AbrB/MazE/SpoVT family DNA-binding domain-containing protein [Deltaproteobacteria bacterium]|nr:AbrB/MazE/SpoVT family DNA-binding domain-containing protein [Deltaproteobacteria bacterium]